MQSCRIPKSSMHSQRKSYGLKVKFCVSNGCGCNITTKMIKNDYLIGFRKIRNKFDFIKPSKFK